MILDLMENFINNVKIQSGILRLIEQTFKLSIVNELIKESEISRTEALSAYLDIKFFKKLILVLIVCYKKSISHLKFKNEIQLKQLSLLMILINLLLIF